MFTSNNFDLEMGVKKLYQAEKVYPNKQMLPTRIEIIKGDPTNKCPLQESKSFWGAPSHSTKISLERSGSDQSESTLFPIIKTFFFIYEINF